MYTLPNFCRVCLKYDKNLIDLEHIENEPNETLMSKLEQCVSEVEWTEFKPLLCHPCIKRLNIAHTFKKQCVQSATMLKSYMTLVKECKSGESPGSPKDAFVMMGNQKCLKITVPPSPGTFQTVFLNVVPPGSLETESKSKDTNQNVFTTTGTKSKTVNQLLNEGKTEELSVEIDPTDFGLGDGGSDNDEDDDSAMNDWEDIISSTQIKSNGSNGRKKVDTSSGRPRNFVPILPKQPQDEKMDFFNTGQHFLTSEMFGEGEYPCEKCQQQFNSVQELRKHMKQVHIGQFPYQCDYCFTKYPLKAEYEICVKSHKLETDPLGESALTLDDFPAPQTETIPDESGGPGDLICDVCNRQFNSTAGLLRHKVRKHNHTNKKKYFIKGMKNARCDICNRDFSTQSYMQLHRKLHLRSDIGYKYKVFGKRQYNKPEETETLKNEDSDDQNGN